jgi:hypothetical protein
MIGIHQQQAKLLLRGKLIQVGLIGNRVELASVE